MLVVPDGVSAPEALTLKVPAAGAIEPVAENGAALRFFSAARRNARPLPVDMSSATTVRFTAGAGAFATGLG